MRSLKMLLCVMVSLLVLNGCASPKPTLQPVASPQMQLAAPAQWAMEPPSSSLQSLDATFTTSGPESSATSKN